MVYWSAHTTGRIDVVGSNPYGLRDFFRESQVLYTVVSLTLHFQCSKSLVLYTLWSRVRVATSGQRAVGIAEH